MYYYEYWGLKKPPFDNVPDPSMYVSSHASVENAIAETLFAIEEGNECIAVIVGDVGLGKTMSLRMVIDSIDEGKYKIAFVTNPDIPFVQLLREIIGQLSGKQCEKGRKAELLETFNRLLFEAIDEGKKVLIFIDEANAMSPANLESLRLLTNVQPDEVNLFTIVLAGQLELAKRLEHPKRANLFQRIGTYCTMEKIGSKELVKNYVETRLALAGGTRNIFTDDAFDLLWEYCGYGVPRLINKTCKLCLKAGETNGLEQIGGDMVKQIAGRFEKLSGPAVPKRRPRVRVSEELTQEEGEPRQQDIPVQEADSYERSDASVTDENAMEPRGHEPQATLEETAEARGTAGEEDVAIGKYGINVSIPSQIMEQMRSYTEEHRTKLAGVLAAQTMQKFPQLTSGIGADPVSIWSEIREVVLARLRQGTQVEVPVQP